MKETAWRRKTKIICTIGPSSESEEMVKKLCLAGMNVARLNFSHGTHEDHKQRIDTIKKVREELDLPIALLLDTKGPEYRIGTFRDGAVELKNGDPFTFTAEQVEGDNSHVSVSYKGLPGELNQGDTILLNDGLMSFEVQEISGSEIRCVVTCGGTLSNRKSMSFPGKHIKQKYLSEQDKSDIKFGVENDVDIIACSFVSVKQDLLDVRDWLHEVGGDDITLIAKIENQSGVDNIDDICTACDGVMVARGDMGVELDFEKLPGIQKDLISKCRMLGKQVITATEMLESMTKNPRPTRAEVSDVANAVYDMTSAIMLSGETAAGDYPIEACETMSKIAVATESRIHYARRFHHAEFTIHDDVDAVSHGTCDMALDIDANAIVACTLTGMTARMIARFRPPMDILGLTTNRKRWYQISLSWGVTPVMCEQATSTEVLFYTAKNLAKEVLLLEKGDKIVLTGGVTIGESGNTSMIKIENI
ncbi:MAG: pyruvate kinase [Eubacterium sp.]|nr:pyruvate kinase [Eubacterium sp.]